MSPASPCEAVIVLPAVGTYVNAGQSVMAQPHPVETNLSTGACGFERFFNLLQSGARETLEDTATGCGLMLILFVRKWGFTLAAPLTPFLLRCLAAFQCHLPCCFCRKGLR